MLKNPIKHFLLLINYFIVKMASVEASKLSKADHDELCCSYAALLLHDDGLEITVSRSNFEFMHYELSKLIIF